MASRIVLRNKTRWCSDDFRPINWRLGMPLRTRRGETPTPVDCVRAIPADDPRSTYRAGEAFHDRDEDVVYRVVHSLPPDGGWASTAFWQDRYKVRHVDVLQLAKLGYLDAAFEAGSQVRRYRCRNEPGMKAEPAFKKICAQAVKRKAARSKAALAKASRGKPWRK